MPSLTRRHLLVLVVALTVAGGCGADDGFDAEPVPTSDGGVRVADARFDGRFEIVQLVADGTDVALARQPTIEIETEFGGLRVDPGCNTHFGSFTLAEDGGASFTVTGGSSDDCGDLDDQEDAVLAVLASVDQWIEVDVGFRFEGSGSSLSVRGPAG